ncbi:hypothetical protein [Streptomyces orinoci]|uniref:Uncharacterized protein n=1 Tax=Streptomyces orinoci TaxID=67339 RepID=A0ABV3K3G6_STRON|nr:hypothetical protein [Streptomyces orinoci]
MTSTPESPDHVSVHLTGCAEETAQAVIDALRTPFPQGAEVIPARPQATGGAGHPLVWCTVVDTRGRRRSTGIRVELREPVDAGLFGAADPVHQVIEELAAAFGVEERGTVPGEHELEVRLRLTPLPKG